MFIYMKILRGAVAVVPGKRLNVGAVVVAAVVVAAVADGVNENVPAVVGFGSAKPKEEPTDVAVVVPLAVGNNELLPPIRKKIVNHKISFHIKIYQKQTMV
jgi:hypothetical protein